MKLLIWVLALSFVMNSTFASLSIVKVALREPRDNDIGLIFDLCVSNSDSDKKETVEFLIRPDGGCFLNITKDRMMCNAGRIVGANFGLIEAGTVETVSLIWPTVSLFNRIGYCPIVLTSTNSKNVQTSSKQLILFDTRFEILDPDGNHLQKRKDYTDCKNWDKEYFKNCIPVNCEERYFGRRSYYNYERQRCEEVVRCTQRYEVYDEFANECIDTKHIYDEEDVEKIRRGHYEKSTLNLRPTYETVSTNLLSYADDQHSYDDEPVAEIKNDVIRDVENELESDESTNNLPYWLQGLANGLLIVFATIAIYVLICFIIFLIVSCLSGRQQISASSLSPATPAGETTVVPSGYVSKSQGRQSTNGSEVNFVRYTSSSLLSQR